MTNENEAIHRADKQRHDRVVDMGSRFMARLRSEDPLLVVAGGHVFIEHEVKELIELLLPELPSKTSGRMHGQKVNILGGLGVFNKEEVALLNDIAQLRNDYVHDPDAELDAHAARRLFRMSQALLPEKCRLPAEPAAPLDMVREALSDAHSIVGIRHMVIATDEKHRRAITDAVEHFRAITTEWLACFVPVADSLTTPGREDPESK